MFLLSGVPAPNPQPWWFLLAGAFEGAGSGILIPTAIALVADRSDPIHRGQIFGICIGGFDLGIALGGPLLGLVSQYFGYSILFASNGIFTITAIILFLTMSNITLQDSFRFATGRTQDFYHHKMQK
jgi:MFS family permease